MFFQLIIILSIAWYVYNRVCNKKLIDLSSKLKSDILTLPVIGHAYMFMGSNERVMNALQKFGRQAIKYGGLTKFWKANYLFVVVADPKAVEIISKSYFHKPDILKVTRLLIGNGSIFAAVPIWRPRRKILAPIFSIKTLNSFVPIFSKQSIDLTNRIRGAEGKEPFSIWEYFTTYTMNSVCETTLGIQIDKDKFDNNEFLLAFDKLTQIAGEILFQPWKNIDFVYKLLPVYPIAMKNIDIVVDFVINVIRTKRKELMENIDKQDLTLLEHLIMSNKSLTERELLEEVLVLIIAGTDTSAVGLSFTSLMLAMHQDIQEKLYEELQEVFGDSDKPVQVSDLPKLKYTEAVIKETLRLYPPVPVILKEADKDLDFNSEITIPNGCGIMVNIWALHRNTAVWGDDAEQFRPERFLEDKSQLHPAAFVPFSCGPRGCLGYQYAMMTMKTNIATLMRRYQVFPASEEQKQRPMRLKYDLMMRDVDKYMVKIKSRC